MNHRKRTLLTYLGLTSAAVAIVTGTADSQQLQDAGCIVVTPYDTVLYDPVLGEDTGVIYCPTGQTTGR